LVIRNRNIYLKDPSERKLVNEGVANVSEDQSKEAMDVLRYELETFVCNGQYKQGLQHILETYLKNIEQAQQPAVWVSGFFGSGKSHLVKMLRALWVDLKFSDGATARNIASLPTEIQDQFKELSMQSKRHNGLHAASGTLGSAASGSVRLALLRIVFKSAKLPEQYPVARFVLWLKSEGIYDQVRDLVEQKGYDWQEELDNFYVAEGLHQALVKVKPNLFSSTVTCVETLNNNYPYVEDISNDEMVKAIRQTLTREGKFPLTLVVLDEIQQFIGQDSQRAMDVQEVVEACCKQLGGRLLFVGTGQTAITGTTNLKKLEGRFTVRIELSDTDVEEVIRQVILAKKADAIKPVKEVMQNNLGEISRHLSETSIGHRQDDLNYFTQDYPILPVRRRFWEYTLRVLDPTGTESQLRNQLSMVHKAIQTNLDQPLGNVIPADYLYFDAAEKLLQARILPRKVHEKTLSWRSGSEKEQLLSRACGLVFLINKLAGSNKDVGIRATADTLADLLVEDLSTGSGSLRNKLGGLLDSCELLMKVGDEYRIQTEESTAWNDEYASQVSKLANQPHHIESERDHRIRQKVSETIKGINPVQGNSKVSRTVHPIFESDLPADKDEKIYIWVRHGWNIDENSVRADARQAGGNSPTVFAFIPKRSADDLRDQIIKFKAASNTLDLKGVPNNPEGQEARASMETNKQAAEKKIVELISEAISEARVFQGGGNELQGSDLRESLQEASENALQRLYYQFHVADNPNWEKVYNLARQGAPDALKAIGYEGEPGENPVCKAVRSFIGGGKKGSEIRDKFESPPYGWSRDTVDGALHVLLTANFVIAIDEKSKTIDHREMERKAIGKATFKVESTIITTQQKIQIRKLIQETGYKVTPGEEMASVPYFLNIMYELAERAGGEPPKPEKPDTSILDEIKFATGNEQLLIIFNRSDELSQAAEQWSILAEKIEERWPCWEALQELVNYAGAIKAAQEAKQQIQTIESQRLLLNDPDPISPIVKSLENDLRQAIVNYFQRYKDELNKQMKSLEADSSWQQLTEEQRSSIMQSCGLEKPETMEEIDVSTRQLLIDYLRQHPLNNWDDRINALPGRFSKALDLAAKELEPEVHSVELPKRILKTEQEVEEWLNEIKEQLNKAIGNGPVVIK